MALETTTNRASYSGNGVTTAFAFPYRFLANADLKVILRQNSTGTEVLQVLTTNYTVTGAGGTSGGTVTMIVAPPTGYTLTIIREPAATQGVDFKDNDANPAEVTENQFDRAFMCLQRALDLISRSAILTDGNPVVFNPTLPALIVPNTTLAFNATGDGFATGPSIVDVAAAAANAAAAAASAAAAAASASAASTSATNAATSATNAATSATNAAASAAAAAASASAMPWDDVAYKVFGDSPITVVDGDNGTTFSVDTSGGAVVINLPQISALTLSNPWVIAIKKTNAGANGITINRGGTDTFDDGSTSKTILTQGSWAFLIPDTDGAPDKWTILDGSSSGGAGGGGSLKWVESANAPINAIEVDQQVFKFEALIGQELYTNVRVPTSYSPGLQVKLRVLLLSAGTSNNTLIRSQATLIRSGTDVITSSTNQRTSTNSAITLSGATAEKPQAVVLDLTDSSGQINGVAIAAGDLIKVRMYRDTDTATEDTRVLVDSAEVTFNG